MSAHKRRPGDTVRLALTDPDWSHMNGPASIDRYLTFDEIPDGIDAGTPMYQVAGVKAFEHELCDL